jgi:hypothetical protein
MNVSLGTPRRRLSAKNCFFIALAIYILVVIFNTGFIATDEYWDGVIRYVPAQRANVQSLIHEDDVKSPLQILPMHWASQAAYKLGIESPFQQYHFVIVFWGLVGFLLSAWAARLLFRRDEELLYKISLLLLAFHFGAPGLLTRPMFEALAAPWIALACAFAVLYDRDLKMKPLLAGVFCASMAFTLRQQTGFCALVFVILPLLHRRWTDFFAASAAGLGFFVLSGVPDIFLRGGFHYSLRALADYNFKYGSHYGSQPWHFFFPLIFAAMFVPWLIARYPSGFLPAYFRRYRSLFIILALFLLLHSMFANKFERFLISMIPVMLFLMTPLLGFFVQNFRRYRWRLGSMGLLNLVLWLPASFFPAQGNIIDLARFMDRHPEYTALISVDNSIEWLPDAFIRAPQFEIKQLTGEQLRTLDPKECHNLVAVNEKALSAEHEFLEANFQRLDHFTVNAIESVAYKLNAEHNVRRSPITVFGCR